MKKVFLAIAVTAVLLLSACEPTVALEGTIVGWPHCPTTIEGFMTADSVPLGCPVPE